MSDDRLVKTVTMAWSETQTIYVLYRWPPGRWSDDITEWCRPNCTFSEAIRLAESRQEWRQINEIIGLNSPSKTWARRRQEKDRSVVHCTFAMKLELVLSQETSAVKDVVGLEGDSEETSIWQNTVMRPYSTESRHLAISQRHVEVGKLDIVAPSWLTTTVQ